jgi:hypothetical protein
MQKRVRRLRHHGPRVHFSEDMRNRPLAKTLRERAEREIALERRTTSQMLFGDPAPGYSALDRRTRGRT